MGTYQTSLLFAFFLSSISTTLLAHDGIINVSGKILTPTCSITDDSRSKSISLGVVNSRALSGVNSAANAVEFSISLKDCDASNAKLTFSGLNDSDNPSLLAIKDTIDSAEGVAIAILDDNKNIIALDEVSKAYALDPDESVNTLRFYAEYMATRPQIKSGEANAVATFTVSYD